MVIALEAKRVDEIQSLLTLDHFQAIIDFEQWFYHELKYPVPNAEIPCIPSGNLDLPFNPDLFLADVEPLKEMTFFDLCYKKNRTTDE